MYILTHMMKCMSTSRWYLGMRLIGLPVLHRRPQFQLERRPAYPQPYFDLSAKGDAEAPEPAPTEKRKRPYEYMS